MTHHIADCDSVIYLNIIAILNMQTFYLFFVFMNNFVNYVLQEQFLYITGKLKLCYILALNQYVTMNVL